MSWIKLPLKQREAAVSEIDDLIEAQCPDRFWYSQDQDGDTTQQMTILLPYGADVYYQVLIQTTQLKALRELAGTYQYTHEQAAIPQEILDRVSIVGEEQFEISEDCTFGVLYSIVLDVPGLTHVVVDNLLDDFLQRGGVPPQPRATNPINLVKRLVEAQEKGYLREKFLLE